MWEVQTSKASFVPHLGMLHLLLITIKMFDILPPVQVVHCMGLQCARAIPLLPPSAKQITC